MAFNTTLTKYDLVEKQAAAPTGTGIGTAGYQAQYDVYNSVTGEQIIASSVTPRSAAFTALKAALTTATVNLNSVIVTYLNSSGSVSAEMVLATAS
jgi:hypothetical protein